MNSTSLSKILYAEDEADIRSIAEIALEDIGGFSVNYCRNGREVLLAAENYTPDLLLFDVMMPEMDGPTTLTEIRKLVNFKNIPAIFMTAKIQTDEVEKYKALGAIEVIGKPFDPMTLADLIKTAWEKHNEQY